LITGCVYTNTYKSIRHVKCDETYPACKRCTTTGRVCDGFAQSSAEWEIVTVSSISSSSISPSPEIHPSPARYDEKAEVCLSFFQHRTIDYLAGLLNQQWKPLMLRAADQNDAIYHAMLAMGSMHKTVVSRQSLSTDLDDDVYAVKQYTRSMRMLASELNKDNVNSIDIILTACILYIGFEVMQLSWITRTTLIFS
jgi:hypothetical protein